MASAKEYVIVEKKGFKSILVEKEQAEKTSGLNQSRTVVSQPALSTTFFNGANQDSIFIKNNQAGVIRSLTLRFQISADANCQIMPVPYWFDRIEILDRKSGKILQRINNDNLFLNLMTYDQHLASSLAEEVSYHPETYYLSPRLLKANTNRYFWLPLTNSLFDHARVNLKELSSATEIEIRCYAVGSILADSSGAVVTLRESAVKIEEIYEDPDLAVEIKKAFKNNIKEHYFTDYAWFQDSYAMVASGSTAIPLDSFNQKANALTVMVRSAARATSGPGTMKLIDLDNCTFDIQNNNGESLFANSRPVLGAYLKGLRGPDFLKSHYLEKEGNNVYIIPLSNSLAKILTEHTVVDGFLQFDSTKNQVVINTPAASVNEVQTLTLAGAAAGAGVYRLSFRGYATNDLAHNTSAANIKAALEALPSFSKTGLQVTVSAALSAGTTVTFTFTDRSGNAVDLNGDLVTCALGLGVTGATSASTARTTLPTFGFVAGTYNVSVYASYYRALQVEDGMISSYQL